ncbi:MAG: hypothetical protein LWX56_08965, partial [Ignavibacteria bacterium]|nr:hypothetical protein [Ignavibacteria bacterium]
MKTSVEQQYGYMLEERIQQISLLSKNIFSPSYYGLHSGAKIKASCIKCASPSCIQYDSISENELPLKSMPSTTDYSVCPS